MFQLNASPPCSPGRPATSTSWKRNGFTLIELLVVIAIIALLVSILMPSLRGAKDLAKQTVCLGNMNSLGKSMLVYAGDDAQLRIPPPLSLSSTPDERQLLHHYAWAGDVDCYADLLVYSGMASPTDFQCPAAANVMELYEWAFDPVWGLAPYYTQFGTDDIFDHRLDYSINVWTCEPYETTHPGRGTFDQATGRGPQPYLFSGDKVMLAGGCMMAEILPGQFNFSAKATGRHDLTDGRGNYAFFDGHAETLTWREAYGVDFVPEFPDGYAGFTGEGILYYNSQLLVSTYPGVPTTKYSALSRWWPD